MVHELGLERWETVWSLSAIVVKDFKDLLLVREDQSETIYDLSIIFRKVSWLVTLFFYKC